MRSLSRAGKSLPLAQACFLLGMASPAPSLVQPLLQLIHSPRVSPLRSFGVRARPHCRVRLLGPLTETCLAFPGLDARSHHRAQSPHPLAGAVVEIAVSPTLARLGYRFPPAQACSPLAVAAFHAGAPAPAHPLVRFLSRVGKSLPHARACSPLGMAPPAPSLT